MLEIFLDAETIPDQRPGALDEYLATARENFRAPSTLTKEQAATDLGITDKDEIKFTGKDAMVARWVEHFREQKAPEQAEAEWRKTSFDGSRGEIVVIGYAIADRPAVTLERPNLGPGSETAILHHFFDDIESAILAHHGSKFDIRLIGHNIEAFDLRFLFQRAVIRGVTPTINLTPKRYSDGLYDTMTAWAGWQGRISLDNLCEALGVTSPKGEMDGSMVWDYVRDGRASEVAEYCRRDVEATREVYRRLTFAGLQAA